MRRLIICLVLFQAIAPVSEADGETIIEILDSIQPSILNALSDIIPKRNAFDSLPLGGVSALIKQDLGQLCPALESMENALIVVVPVSWVTDHWSL
jgi:hypothetical protein